jgi:hypothetical protein
MHTDDDREHDGMFEFGAVGRFEVLPLIVQSLVSWRTACGSDARVRAYQRNRLRKKAIQTMAALIVNE